MYYRKGPLFTLADNKTGKICCKRKSASSGPTMEPKVKVQEAVIQLMLIDLKMNFGGCMAL